MPQKIIITVRKLSDEFVHGWQGFAEGVLQVPLFTTL